MANTRSKPSDFTGRQRDKLMQEHANEVAEAAERMSMITAQAAREFDEGVYDATKPDNPLIVDEVVGVGVEMADDTVVIRVNSEIPNMTFGVGNHYTFKEGGKYRVPRELADHLEELGYVWH